MLEAAEAVIHRVIVSIFFLKGDQIVELLVALCVLL